MITKFFKNGLSIFFARGGPLLALPFLTKALSLEEFGYYVLVQTLIPLLSAVVTMNLSAATLREGILEKDVAPKIMVSTYPFSILAIVIGIMGGIAFNDSVIFSLASVTIILIVTNGNHEILISYFRSQNREHAFLGISFFRAFAIIAAALATYIYDQSFLQFMIYYAVQYIIISIFFTFLSSTITSPFLFPEDLRPYLKYTLPLLPYSIGQWVLASSNRYVLFQLEGAEESGLYGIAYLLSSPMVLFLSVLGLVFSKDILEKFDQWKERNKRVKTVSILWLMSIVSIGITYMLVYVDEKLYNFTNVSDIVLLELSLLISAAVFPLCCNTIYGNILFYHKKSYHIAASIVIACITNVLLTYFLVFELSIIGAAYAAVLSNLIYCTITLFLSSRILYEKKVDLREMGLLLILSLSLVGIIYSVH